VNVFTPVRSDIPATSRLTEAPSVAPDRLHLGCGPNAPPNWLNVDGSWNAWLTHHPYLRRGLETIGITSRGQGALWKVRPLVHDLTKPLPFAANRFSAVYASHVLEHLYLRDAQKLLADCRRVLKPGGVVRIVVPDLRSMAAAYLDSKEVEHPDSTTKELAADKFNEGLSFRSPAPPTGSPLYKLYTLWKNFHHHKWMYDSESLTHYVEAAGFTEVSPKQYLQSAISGIVEVEEADRLLDGAGVCVEGRKP
jgi:SAM-dependent methyltransferase